MKYITLKFNPLIVTEIYFHIYQHRMMQIKKETANCLEYKVSHYANKKPRMVMYASSKLVCRENSALRL